MLSYIRCQCRINTNLALGDLIGDVIVCVIVWGVINRWIELRLDQTKTCKINMVCLPTKHLVLGWKGKDWLSSRNQENASNTSYAVYDLFEVGDEVSNYRLTVGKYTGNAGNRYTNNYFERDW
jgi:hypothetical protein